MHTTKKPMYPAPAAAAAAAAAGKQATAAPTSALTAQTSTARSNLTDLTKENKDSSVRWLNPVTKGGLAIIAGSIVTTALDLPFTLIATGSLITTTGVIGAGVSKLLTNRKVTETGDSGFKAKIANLNKFAKVGLAITASSLVAKFILNTMIIMMLPTIMAGIIFFSIISVIQSPIQTTNSLPTTGQLILKAEGLSIEILGSIFLILAKPSTLILGLAMTASGVGYQHYQDHSRT